MTRKTVLILHAGGPERALLDRAFPSALWRVEWFSRSGDLPERGGGAHLLVTDSDLADDLPDFSLPRLLLQRGESSGAAQESPSLSVIHWPCPVPALMAAVRSLLPDPATPPLPLNSPASPMIGTSPALQRLYHQIEAAAHSDAPVFITGETGTGKELCAQTLHRLSPRHHAPFVPLNCAAIPRDLMESELFGHVRGAFTGATSDRLGAIAQADGGILFLDEVGDLPLPLQAKLLRFLQDFQYSPVGSSASRTARVRIICATNHDPLSLVSRGLFRADLYYRLHVISLHLPPLRERGADIEALALHFLLQFSRQEGKSFSSLSSEAIATLRHHPWPGNVRQLQNALRHVAVFHDGPVLEALMFPESLFSAASGVSFSPARVEEEILPLWMAEKRAIEAAITACRGNVQRAAQLLEIAPSTIYRKRLSWPSPLPAQGAA